MEAAPDLVVYSGYARMWAKGWPAARRVEAEFVRQTLKAETQVGSRDF